MMAKVNDKQQSEIDSIYKSTVLTEYNQRLVNLEQSFKNYQNLNTEISVLKGKVEGIEKVSIQFIDYILKSTTLTEQNQRLANLEQQFEKYEIATQQLKNDISNATNNSINQQGNQTQISQNNTDTLLKFQNELEDVKSQIISINQDLSFQFNKTQSNINTISTSIQSLPSLSTDLYLLSGVVNSLSQQVPALNKTISTLDFKINSDTLTKVELLGPFIPKHHLTEIQLSIDEYKILQTTEPCIFDIKGKAVISLYAIGIAISPNCASELIFMINRDESKIKLNDQKWAFQSYYVNGSWLPVSLVQEFIIENQDRCEITLAIKKYQSEGTTVYFYGMSFSVKITYLS